MTIGTAKEFQTVIAGLLDVVGGLRTQVQDEHLHDAINSLASIWLDLLEAEDPAPVRWGAAGSMLPTG